ncbi:hypothetical protein HWD97_02495 [Ochrobactrum sp. C6C9]|uniref:hypothetical protein n=1 Tax=Ochrobactrum sp. C6C9 TaxID=2736662 RepID=UPI00353027C8|nr:hypothetical protein [Ochrobactrum sp. C6C9]
MALPFKKFMELTDEQLIKSYDDGAPFTSLSLSYIREELARRENARQTQAMLDMTKTIRRLSWWMTAMATISTLSVIVPLFYSSH